MKVRFILLFTILFTSSCQHKTLIFESDEVFVCNGIYPFEKLNNAKYFITDKLPLEINFFELEFEFKSNIYKNHWPIMFGEYNRIMGIKLEKNGSITLTVNNQKKIYTVMNKYDINEWYKVRMIYNRGNIEIALNDERLFGNIINLKKRIPSEDLKFTSCNFSNGICFDGELRHIKVSNLY